jgi:hypothetical protein
MKSFQILIGLLVVTGVAVAGTGLGRLPEQVASGLRLHRSGVNVRWDSPLGRQLTELAIITTAREHDQPYEWSLHEMEAVAVGLAPAVIDVVRLDHERTGRSPGRPGSGDD